MASYAINLCAKCGYPRLVRYWVTTSRIG